MDSEQSAFVKMMKDLSDLLFGDDRGGLVFIQPAMHEHRSANCLLLDADVPDCSVIMIMKTNTQLALSFGFVSSAGTQRLERSQEALQLSPIHCSCFFCVASVNTLSFHPNYCGNSNAKCPVSQWEGCIGSFGACCVQAELIAGPAGG